MKTRILLSENANSYNELIAAKKQDFANGQKLISMLDKIGLKVDIVSDWQIIEQEVKKDYPKAPLTFNLQANGLETEYREAEAFYMKNKHRMSFEPLTDEKIESIKEQQRKYTSNEKQNEAIELFKTVTESLLRLKDLGVSINPDKTYLVSRVIVGDQREKPSIKIDPKALYETVINLK